MTGEKVVYVVDDDPAVLSSVAALLSLYDYDVHCYADAVHFLDDVDLANAACLVTDVQMPDIDGAELLHRLKASNSPISVIVVTGVADVPTAVTLMERGAVTLLEKPYDQTVLLDAIERALAASREYWNKQQAAVSVQQRLQMLSSEEDAVMQLMLAGKPNKCISSKLDLSMRTVDRRRQAVLTKMQVESVPELAILISRSN
jgi:two-component system response regulator FixJ